MLIKHVAMSVCGAALSLSAELPIHLIDKMQSINLQKMSTEAGYGCIRLVPVDARALKYR